MTQKVQRSFTAADEVIYRDAIKNPLSKQCYKALAAMHGAFGRLADHVQEMANTANARKEIELKNEELFKKNTGEAIDKICADLKALRAENASSKK